MRPLLLPALLCLLVAAGPIRAQPAVAPFTVEVSLSPKAAARLASMGEGITVSAMFYGDPTPAARRQVDEMGQVDIGREEVTIPGQSGTASITGGSITASKLALLRNRNIKVLINVYSARKKSADNLLFCDLFQDTVTLAASHPIHIGCKLIAESF